ncbi:predicted protein [Histoplasma capsulatum H143]|uniref:Uncharacterized protein n=1 Tax=Ajellomyces capsulatus (strain H143) TaxID=544712 RepID=C6H5U2_AJECH|nr:predicted protein [Histoplasma capsulatum H143]
MIFGKQESCIWLGPMVADIQAPDIGGRPPRLTTSGGPMIVVSNVGRPTFFREPLLHGPSGISPAATKSRSSKAQLQLDKSPQEAQTLYPPSVFSTVKLHLYHCTAKAKASLRTGAETVSPSVTPWQNSYILSTILEGLFCSNQRWKLTPLAAKLLMSSTQLSNSATPSNDLGPRSDLLAGFAGCSHHWRSFWVWYLIESLTISSSDNSPGYVGNSIVA